MNNSTTIDEEMQLFCRALRDCPLVINQLDAFNAKPVSVRARLGEKIPAVIQVTETEGFRDWCEVNEIKPVIVEFERGKPQWPWEAQVVRYGCVQVICLLTDQEKEAFECETV